MGSEQGVWMWEVGSLAASDSVIYSPVKPVWGLQKVPDRWPSVESWGPLSSAMADVPNGMACCTRLQAERMFGTTGPAGRAKLWFVPTDGAPIEEFEEGSNADPSPPTP